MNPRAREALSWPALAGLVLALTFPSIGMALLAGPALALGYLVLAAVWIAVYSQWVAPWLQRTLTRGSAIGVALAVLVLIAAAIAVIHPLIDMTPFTIAGHRVGASDNDDAVRLGVAALLRGENPYLEHTFLGQPLGPLPGAFVLGLPFYLLGNVAFATVFFLGVFWYLAARLAGSAQSATALLLLVLTAGPAVLFHAVTGKDYATDIITILGLTALVLHLLARESRWWPVAAVGVGLAMATRINLVLLVVPLGAIVVGRYGRRAGALVAAAVLGGFVAVSLPFYLWDPANFAPLQAGAAKAEAVPFGAFLVPAVGLVVALMLLRLPHTGVRDFYRDAFWIQLTVVGLVTLLQYLTGSPIAEDYFTYGMLALFPGALYFWVRVTSAARDGGDDGDRGRVADGGVQAVGEPDVLVVDVDVDEAP